MIFACRRKKRLPKMVFEFIDGAAGYELTAGRNRRQLDDVLLKQEVLIDVSKRTTATKVFGQDLAYPFMIGPTGLNGAFWVNGDLHLAQAAKEANIPFIISTCATSKLNEIERVAGDLRWFQLYMLKDRGLAKSLLDRIAGSGFHVLELTIDTPIPGRRNRDVRNGFTIPFRWNLANFFDTAMHPRWALSMLKHGAPTLKVFAEIIGKVPTGRTVSEVVQQQFSDSFTWNDIDWLRDHWQGKLVLKGVSSAANTRQAISLGLDGVVISNHGGRQLEGARSTIECLPEVADAAAGSCTVLIDSGFRSGSDIAKAIALGADAVQLGRSTLYGLAAGGKAGVSHALKILGSEFDIAMALSGARTPQELRGRVVGLRQPSEALAAVPTAVLNR